MKKIYLYADYGCGRIESFEKTLKLYFTPQDVQIEITDAERIKHNCLVHDAPLALIIGGGAATPYKRKLGREGIQKIQEYVTSGGIYFGICAGGYFGCEDIIFEKGTNIEISNKGLGLLDSTCIGTLKPFLDRMIQKDLMPAPLGICHYDNTAASETVLSCSWVLTGETFKAPYAGGGYFSGGAFETLAVFKTYTETNAPVSLPLIIKKTMGKGLVVLSGIHIEKQAEHFIQGIPPDSPQWNRLSFLAEELKQNKIDIFEQIAALIR